MPRAAGSGIRRRPLAESGSRVPGAGPRVRVLGAQPADLRLDEVVDLAVENPARIAGLQAGPDILDVLVGMQDVVTDLRPPAACGRAAQVSHLGLLLLAFALE